MRVLLRIHAVLLCAWLASLNAAFADDPLYTAFPDTVFDVLHADDPTTFVCLTPRGSVRRAIWDRRVNGEPTAVFHRYLTAFADGHEATILVNTEISTNAAREIAESVAVPLGQIPPSLRAGVQRVTVHDGFETFHAGTSQMILYAGKIRVSQSSRQFEEAVLHEAVHSSWDESHRLNSDWVAAQAADGQFLTEYGKSFPEREDLAETVVFAYGIHVKKRRIPPVDALQIRRFIPNRMVYLRDLFEKEAPVIGGADCPY